MIEGKRVLLIITGSIAAFKSLELIRLLTKAGARVEAALTPAGATLVAPLSVEALTGGKAHLDMWDKDAFDMNHIELSRRNDLVVVAPASADFIAKMALGLGDDLASTVVLAGNKPVIVAPSMNVEMWNNPAFRRNLDRIAADGATIVPPQEDILVCGETGVGKMADPATLFALIGEHFSRAASLKGKRAIVTSGGTIERIDSVRFISNFSSGKQGFAIAEELAAAGAEVTLVAGRTDDAPPARRNIELVRVESAEDMRRAAHAALPADIFVAAAAVCDFKVSNQATGKIKKDAGLNLEFSLNPDILQSVGELPPGKRPALVIGFAAETVELLPNAAKKLQSKRCDLIVANDVSDGRVFGQDSNQAHFVTAEETRSLPPMPKRQLARELVSWIAQRL